MRAARRPLPVTRESFGLEVSVSRPRRWLLTCTLASTLAAALVGRAEAVSCDQPTPQGNATFLGCSPLAQTCTVFDVSAPAGCHLDYGHRKVVFQGTFDVGSTTLTVNAAAIEVRGTLRARSDNNQRGGTIQLVATGAVVVSGLIDVSGNSAGLVRITAGDVINLAGGRLRGRGIEQSTAGNTASGGIVDLVAGTSVSHTGTIDLSSGNGGGGGTLTMRAGTNIWIGQSISATGGANDGGDVDLLAGDDITIDHPIDVSSPLAGGGGGSIRIRAGVDRLGGTKTGGSLAITANLTANGSGDADSGYDGGDISLAAFGPVTVASTATLRARGSSPDGSGGSVSIDSSDSQLGRMTSLDGDLSLAGPIDVSGPAADSDGGDVDILVGRDGTITGNMDLSGGNGGGNLTLTGGRTVAFGALVNANGSAAFGGGGSVSMRTGISELGSLSVTKNLNTSAGTNGTAGDVTLASCNLDLGPKITANASTSSPSGNPRIDLVATTSMVVGSGGSYLAKPNGRVALIHPPGLTPQVLGATFSPRRIEITDDHRLFPACPVCGDGIRQTGEPCDKGVGADGTCCNGDCSALTCPTTTPTTTVTPTSTAPTRSPTPSRTPTPPFTVAPTGPTANVSPTPPEAPAPTATAVLPFLEPKPVLRCEKVLGKATSALVMASMKTLESCSLDAFKCIQTRAAGPDRSTCLTAAGRRCNTRLAKLTTALEAFSTQTTGACGGDPPRVPTLLLRSADVLGFSRIESICVDLGLTLTSPEAIVRCVQFLTSCETDRALAMGIPRVSDLLNELSDGSVHGLCLPNPLGATDGFAGSAVAPLAIRCQRAVALGGRKLVARQLFVARGCVDSLLKCRLTGKSPDACAKVALGCRRKLAVLDDSIGGARGLFLASVRAACESLPVNALLDPAGVGFGGIGPRCTELGLGPTTDLRSVATCVARAYGCAGSSLIRQSLPLVDTELARVGLAFGSDIVCALPTPTLTVTPMPTPSVTPTIATTPSPTITSSPSATELATTGGAPSPTVTPTDTPTLTLAETATPAPVSTPGCPNGLVDGGEQCDFGDDVPGDGCDPSCRFERLIPGGGTITTDCIAEWAVINPQNPEPRDGTAANFRQDCVDGDPSCDGDGTPDGTCVFRVGICLQNSDPNLPACSAPPGIAKFLLTSPRPVRASDPIDRDNAVALLASFGRLSSILPSGSSGNTLVFDPPLTLAAPDNCTDTALLRVDRRGLPKRSEKFRITTTSVPPSGERRGINDGDTLILTCVAGSAASSVPTVVPTPNAIGGDLRGHPQWERSYSSLELSSYL